MLIVTGTSGWSAAGVGDPPDDGVSYEKHTYIELNSDAGLVGFVQSNSLPGAGTQANPYVISGWDIEGTSSRAPVSLRDISLYLVIRDCYLHNNSYYGVRLDRCKNVGLVNNTIQNFSQNGIYAMDSSSVLIAGNRVNGTRYYAINVMTSSDIEIRDNACVGNNQGIRVTQTSGVLIDNNTVDSTTWTIYPAFCSGVTVSNNRVTGSGGLPLVCANMRVSGNDLVNMYYAFNSEEIMTTINFSDDNTIDEVPVVFRRDATDESISTEFSQLFFYNCSNISIEGVNSSRAFTIFQIYRSDNVTVSNCTLVNPWTGAQPWSTVSGWDCSVVDTTIKARGLLLTGERHLVSNCSIEGGTYSIRLEASNSTIIDNSLGPDVGRGITIQGGYSNCQNDRIINNTITTSSTTADHRGIYFEGPARNITIIGNTMSDVGIAFNHLEGDGYAELWGSHTITPDNTVGGKPIRYLGSARDADITGPSGQVIVGNCTGVRVHGITFDQQVLPIQCGFSEGTEVYDNTFSDCTRRGYETVVLDQCRGTELYDNVLRNSDGIISYTSDGLLLARNHMEAAGLDLRGTGNITIVSNELVDFPSHVWLKDCVHANISNNRFEGFSSYALRIESDQDIRVLHNNFIDNNMLAGNKSSQCSAPSPANATWDDGALGNYWNNFVDRYPDATNDGTTWDTPYNVTSVLQDHHPLVAMWDTSAPEAVVEQAEFIIDQGDTVTFNASRSTDDVAVVDIIWSFTYGGEDVVLRGAVGSHTFDDAGGVTVLLRVFDAAGNFDYMRLHVRIRDTEPPVADAGPDIVVDQGTLVTLSGAWSTDNVGIAHYNWTFAYNGTDVALQGRGTAFLFDIPGVYDVTLNVTDAACNWAVDVVSVTVRDIEPPVARAGGDVTVDQGGDVILNASASTDNAGIASWSWHLVYDGEDVLLTGPVVHFTFDIAGRYQVTLSVEDAAGNGASDLLWVTVLDTEPPVPVSETLIRVDQGSTVTFDASASTDNVAVAGYNWTFEYGGGTVTLGGATASFTFDEAGEYAVVLRVTDAAGNGATLDILVTVRDVNAPVAVAGEDVTVDQGSVVTFDGSASTDNVGVVGWTWTVEGGAGGAVTLTGVQAPHLFADAGVFTVRLTVADADGLTGWDTLTVTVRDTEPPVAVTGGDEEVELGATLTLDGSASSDNVGVAAWEWAFEPEAGGMETRTGETVDFIFGTVGLWTVTLRVTDAAGNVGTASLQVNVLAPGAPRADAGEDAVIDMGTVHSFDGSRSSSDTPITLWEWTFVYGGEEVTLTGNAPSHAFDVAGVYVVTLRVTNDLGLADTDQVTVRVRDTEPPVAVISWDGRAERGVVEMFGAAGSSDNVGIVNWTWEVVFGSEITNLYGQNVELHRSDPGKYRVTLTVRDAAGNEGSDTVEFEIPGEEAGGSSALLVAAIVIAAVAAALVAAVLVMRRRGPLEGVPP